MNRWKKQFGKRSDGLSRRRGAIRSVLMGIAMVFLAMVVLTGYAQAKTLMLAHTVPPSHVWHKTAVRFAKNLAEQSKGKFKLKISPLSKLGNESQITSMLQGGAIAMAILPVGVMSNREESFLAWFLPYEFDNVTQAGAAAALPAARQMLTSLDKHGIIGVGYTFAGMRHVLATMPVASPKDLEKKKIRAFPSPIFNDWWRANNAAPTALPLGEIAPSLTTNLLDAVDVDLDITVGLKFYQQAPFLALTNHMAFPGVFMASKKWWGTLSDADRALINKVYAEAEQWGIQTQAKAEVSNLKTLKDMGVKITKISLDSFKKVGKEITKKYLAKNPVIAEFHKQAQAAR
jgi:TRAP-type C4-dicarboxylate transport system substrate-binding protein